MYTEPGVGPDENPRSRHRASFMPLLARRAVVRQSDPLGSPSGTAPVNWAVLAEPVARELCMGEIPDLFFFKALTREFQCPAVLRDRANDVIRGSRRHLGCYFEGHRDLSSHQAGKMRDHLVRNPARVAAYPRGIKRSGPMKPRRLRRRRCARRNLPGVRSSAWNRDLSTRPCTVTSRRWTRAHSRHQAVDARYPS